MTVEDQFPRPMTYGALWTQGTFGSNVPSSLRAVLAER